MKKFLYALAILVTIILVGTGFIVMHIHVKRDLEETLVRIEVGENATKISRKLSDKGIISHKTIFLSYLKYKKLDRELSHGVYIFSDKMNMLDVIDKLVNAKVELQRLTIPEGLHKIRTINLLVDNGYGDFDTFYELINDSTYVKDLTGMELSSLEGFLYPDTFYLPWEISEDFLLRFLVDQFFLKVADLDFSNNHNLSFYDVIILASIVEREAIFDDEKPLIASVYLNRLEIGKRLQADPTVAYILDRKNIRRRIIYYRDLEIESPYNTYRNSGLPPTPICSPSISSIKAVLEPEASEYFFFFANNAGRHIFTRTYREHLEKQRILRSHSRN